MSRPLYALKLPRRYVVATHQGGVRALSLASDTLELLQRFDRDSTLVPVFVHTSSGLYWFGVMDPDALYSYEGWEKWPAPIRSLFSSIPASSPLLQPLHLSTSASVVLCGWQTDWLLSTTDAAEFNWERLLSRLSAPARSWFRSFPRNAYSLRVSARFARTPAVTWPKEGVRRVFQAMAEAWVETNEFVTPFAVFIDSGNDSWTVKGRRGVAHIFGGPPPSQAAVWHTTTSSSTTVQMVRWIVPGALEVERHEWSTMLWRERDRQPLVVWSSLLNGLPQDIDTFSSRVESRWEHVQNDAAHGVYVSTRNRRLATEFEVALFEGGARVVFVSESICAHVPFVALSLFLAVIYFRQDIAPPELWSSGGTILHVREALRFGLELWKTFCGAWKERVREVFLQNIKKRKRTKDRRDRDRHVLLRQLPTETGVTPASFEQPLDIVSISSAEVCTTEPTSYTSTIAFAESTEPTTPVEPVNSPILVEYMEPTIPAEAVESTDSTTVPAEPVAPTTPIESMKPTVPAEAVKKTTVSAKAVESTKSAEVLEPSESAEAVESTKLTTVPAVEPSESAEAVESTDSTTVPAEEPVEPTTPLEPTIPTTPLEPTIPTVSAEAVEAAKSAQAVNTTVPTEAVEPTIPIELMKSTVPVESADSTTSTSPGAFQSTPEWDALPMVWTEMCAEVWAILSTTPSWTDMLDMEYQSILETIHTEWNSSTQSLHRMARAAHACWTALSWYVIRGPEDLEYQDWADEPVEMAIEEPSVLETPPSLSISVRVGVAVESVIYRLHNVINNIALDDSASLSEAFVLTLAAVEFVCGRCTLEQKSARRAVRFWARFLGWKGEQGDKTTWSSEFCTEYVRRSQRSPVRTWALRALVWASLPVDVPSTMFTGPLVRPTASEFEWSDPAVDIAYVRTLLSNEDDEVCADIQHLSALIAPDDDVEAETAQMYTSLLRKSDASATILAGAVCFADLRDNEGLRREIFAFLQRSSLPPAHGQGLVYWLARSSSARITDGGWAYTLARAVRAAYHAADVDEALEAAYKTDVLQMNSTAALRLEALVFVRGVRQWLPTSAFVRERARRILSKPVKSVRMRAWWTYAYAYTLLKEDLCMPEVLACIHASLALLATEGHARKSPPTKMRAALWKRAYSVCLALGDGGAAWYYESCLEGDGIRRSPEHVWQLRTTSFNGNRLPGVPIEHFAAEEVVAPPSSSPPPPEVRDPQVAALPLYWFHRTRLEWKPTGGVFTAVGTLRSWGRLGSEVPSWVAAACRTAYIAPQGTIDDGWNVAVNLPYSRRTWILHPLSPTAREQWPEVQSSPPNAFTEALVHPSQIPGAHSRVYPLSAGEQAHVILARLLPVPPVSSDSLVRTDDKAVSAWSAEQFRQTLLPMKRLPSPPFLYLSPQTRMRARETVLTSLFTSNQEQQSHSGGSRELMSSVPKPRAHRRRSVSMSPSFVPWHRLRVFTDVPYVYPRALCAALNHSKEKIAKRLQALMFLGAVPCFETTVSLAYVRRDPVNGPSTDVAWPSLRVRPTWFAWVDGLSTSEDVAQRLEEAGLARDAQKFRMWARQKDIEVEVPSADADGTVLDGDAVTVFLTPVGVVVGPNFPEGVGHGDLLLQTILAAPIHAFWGCTATRPPSGVPRPGDPRYKADDVRSAQKRLQALGQDPVPAWEAVGASLPYAHRNPVYILNPDAPFVDVETVAKKEKHYETDGFHAVRSQLERGWLSTGAGQEGSTPLQDVPAPDAILAAEDVCNRDLFALLFGLTPEGVLQRSSVCLYDTLPLPTVVALTPRSLNAVLTTLGRDAVASVLGRTVWIPSLVRGAPGVIDSESKPVHPLSSIWELRGEYDDPVPIDAFQSVHIGEDQRQGVPHCFDTTSWWKSLDVVRKCKFTHVLNQRWKGMYLSPMFDAILWIGPWTRGNGLDVRTRAVLPENFKSEEYAYVLSALFAVRLIVQTHYKTVVAKQRNPRK